MQTKLQGKYRKLVYTYSIYLCFNHRSSHALQVLRKNQNQRISYFCSIVSLSIRVLFALSFLGDFFCCTYYENNLYVLNTVV